MRTRRGEGGVDRSLKSGGSITDPPIPDPGDSAGHAACFRSLVETSPVRKPLHPGLHLKVGAGLLGLLFLGRWVIQPMAMT